jgi:prepilin-type N-terminal cleavage/methylation domain-containing protein
MVDSSRQPKGFTVAELIVAMTISAVTLLSGYELFAALKTAGDRQSEGLAATAGIVHGLDSIREDLLHAVPRAGSREPIFTGTNPALEGEAQTAQLLAFYSLCAQGGADWVRGLRQIHYVTYEVSVKTKDSLCLYRSVCPAIGTGQVSRELILDSVEQIRIAFRNGEQLEPSFSSKDKLPASVELTVASKGQIWPLSVKLPCGEPEGQP